jgi:nucleotide-binding universal stress UspA family protein
MKILTTLDHSALSEAILASVATIARPLGAEVQLLTVVRPSKIHDTPVTQAVQETYPTATPSGSLLGIKSLGEMLPPLAEVREQAFERVEAEAQDYLRDRAHALEAVPTTRHVVFDDDPAGAIVEHARRERVDLIAMATHGRTGLSHLVAGSVCERVIRSGVAPVMVLRPTPAAERGP